MLVVRQLKIFILFLFGALLIASCKHHQKEVKTNEKTVNKKEKTHHSTAVKGSAGEQALKEKLGLSENQIHKEKIYSFVNDWYGVPYKYGGCKKDGVDCSCFASNLYNDVFHTVLNRTAGDMFKACEQIGSEEAQQGDLFFFKINGDKITHVGVCLKKKIFVHASTSKGVVINSIEEAYYKKYFYCAGRIKKS